MLSHWSYSFQCPLAVKNDLIEDMIIVDSKTGVSGVGRTAKEAFDELNDNCAISG